MEDKSRTFSPWSHVVSQAYAQLTHSISLNDVCDSLHLHSGPLSTIRGATPPSRNGFSNANRERPAEMAEQLFWSVIAHLGELTPGFVAGQHGHFLRVPASPLSASFCVGRLRDGSGTGLGRVALQRTSVKWALGRWDGLQGG